MRYAIEHRTVYEYDTDVSVSHHLARLTPRNLARQRREGHAVSVEPQPALTETREDYFGNPTLFFTVEGAHRTLAVTARSRVEVRPTDPVDPNETPAWETVRDACRGDRPTPALEAIDFVFASSLIPLRPDFEAYARPSFEPDRPILDAVWSLTNRIHNDFTFDAEATTVATPLEKVFRERRGVCQDFAQYAIACLRSLGLPARYVSGYLETEPPPGKPRMVGADASHAWLAFYCPGRGWIDVDPTNNLLPADRHIVLAWGRDFSDVSPLRGVLVGSGAQQLKVAVDVLPLAEVADTSEETSMTGAG